METVVVTRAVSEFSSGVTEMMVGGGDGGGVLPPPSLLLQAVVIRVNNERVISAILILWGRVNLIVNT
jgi:hypothetical protein